MDNVKKYNRYGKELERLLLLKTSPIAVKMLETKEDIPEEAIRPLRDKGIHLAQCQAFAMSRRDGASVAMLKDDNWCWAPLLAYGLVEDPHDPFVDEHTGFPCFDYGKYIGIVSAPLRDATFEPELVLIYSNTAQLRHMLLSVKYADRTLVTSQFDPTDSCVYSVVPVMTTGQYRITLPDPGECARAMAGEDEIIFSIPIDKVAGLVTGLKHAEKRKLGYAYSSREMRPDFPRPDFYKRLFSIWGLDSEN